MANIQNTPNYNKLKNVLKEVFQLDQADLDFGIYRIMNQKRNEINDFLENRLLSQVNEILRSNGDGSNSKVQQELDKAIEQANSLGVDPETLSKVIELRKKLASTVSVDSLEQEVYSYLANFFKRYYKDGDFISLRRYKKDVYAIPYEGEEVKLHWANNDQYYIKTSEYLKNYSFKLPNGKSVKFELKEASSEQNNNKEQSNKIRRFSIYQDMPIEIINDNSVLVINFTYEPHDKKVKQEKLNAESIDVLMDFIPEEFHSILEKRPTDKNKNRTLLEKHIVDFTARNSFDYFIHKDLGGFLSRELDFYIKNEVLYIDDINTDNEQDFISQLSKVKAVKQVANKIIYFLAQLENFQKKLWLKKKFVVSTNYCISLDKIPEKYYEDIAKNKEQIEEWKELFGIHKLKGDLLTQDYSDPVSIDFLKSQPNLVIDTRFFNENFKESLLSIFDDIDSNVTGLLLNSENFQANQLLLNKFSSKVDCVYIDPPYNTTENAFLYKNNFKHSSWLSLMSNGIRLTPKILSDNGALLTAIDDTETASLRFLLEDVFGKNNFLGTIAAEINPAGQNIRSNAPARSHDYFHIFSKDIEKIKMRLRGLTREEVAAFKLVDEQGKYNWDNLRRRGGNSRPSDRPKQWFPIFYSKEHGLRVPTMNWNEKSKQWDITEEVKANEEIMLPIDPKGIKRIWRTNPDGATKGINSGEIDVIEKADRLEISKKSRIPDGKKPKTLWYDSKYSGTSHGTKLLIKLFGPKVTFSYPKSIHLTEDAVRYWVDSDSIVLDYFAGSGTTGHAVVNLNREDGGNRKFILVEMGTYFYSATKPRILKSIYSSEWSNGLPLKGEGHSSIIKYHDLESYEDTLLNISLKNEEGSTLLENSHFNEEYMLKYMLDLESRDSMLNVDAFKAPFNYKLNITRNNESKETVIDLVETFNYLIGLHIKTIQTIKGFKVITCVTNERDEETLVIWRNTEEKSNQDLNEFFTKMEFSTRDSEFQRIYVNGDNHLENLKTGDDNWKVVLIEEEFIKKMFDVQDV